VKRKATTDCFRKLYTLSHALAWPNWTHPYEIWHNHIFPQGSTEGYSTTTGPLFWSQDLNLFSQALTPAYFLYNEEFHNRWGHLFSFYMELLAFGNKYSSAETGLLLQVCRCHSHGLAQWYGRILEVPETSQQHPFKYQEENLLLILDMLVMKNTWWLTQICCLYKSNIHRFLLICQFSLSRHRNMFSSLQWSIIPRPYVTKKVFRQNGQRVVDIYWSFNLGQKSHSQWKKLTKIDTTILYIC
jgi:hypothetical protein